VQQTVVGGPNGRDDYLDNFWPQASSQWDSLRHIRHPEHGWYNGVGDEEIVAGGGKLGIENMARRGIAGRGVLLDVARYREGRGRLIDCEAADAITREELMDCARGQGVNDEPGDVLLIRTGWLTWYFQQPTEVRERISDRANLTAPGLGQPEEMAEYLWNLRLAAVAADNPALEVWPPSDFMHWRLIPLLGMPIGELWWLDDLAADCAEDGVYEFFFTSAPLNVPGGVGSPPNALAIK
jgi:kynurenine formamidase